jgi:hypothetical protein
MIAVEARVLQLCEARSSDCAQAGRLLCYLGVDNSCTHVCYFIKGIDQIFGLFRVGNFDEYGVWPRS